MSRDLDLIVSCKCGKIEIVKYGGYLTSDLVDAAELGKLAEEGCRKKRLKRMASFVGIPVVTAVVLVLGAGWISGEARQRRTEQAENWLAVARNHEARNDWDGAIEAFKKSLEFRDDVKAHLFIGCMYMNKQDYRAAIRECEAALSIEPYNKFAMGALRKALDAQAATLQ